MASERQRAEVADRRARVLRMRTAGMTWDAIAAEVGKAQRQAAAAAGLPAPRTRYSGKHAVVDAKRALAEAQGRLAELADLHLVMEMERLDGLQRTTETLMRQSIQAGDRWQALRAVDRLVQIGRRRDSLLGLSRDTAAAQDAAADEGGSPARDAVDELARKRARRASAR
jgi:hypothetical protein